METQEYQTMAIRLAYLTMLMTRCFSPATLDTLDLVLSKECVLLTTLGVEPNQFVKVSIVIFPCGSSSEHALSMRIE